MKKEKGITLIALVITIIVMLILVLVTVNIAMNGGLFSQAERAKKQTDTEVKKEQITSVLVGAINDTGELTVENVRDKLKKQLGIEDKDIKDTNGTFPLTVTYKGEEFEIESNGVVTATDENGTTNPETGTPNPDNILIAGTYDAGLPMGTYDGITISSESILVINENGTMQVQDKNSEGTIITNLRYSYIDGLKEGIIYNDAESKQTPFTVTELKEGEDVVNKVIRIQGGKYYTSNGGAGDGVLIGGQYTPGAGRYISFEKIIINNKTYGLCKIENDEYIPYITIGKDIHLMNDEVILYGNTDSPSFSTYYYFDRIILQTGPSSYTTYYNK